jgi:hypothetical protein
MCKADCKTPCCKAPACGKTINAFNAERTGSNCGDRNTKTARGTERTAQHTPAIKIPVGLGHGVLPRIQAAHEAASSQSAMHEACAIASAMAASATDDDGRQAISALISHTGTQEHATLQLMKLVGRIGLRNWFDGDFVVLSQEEARRVAASIDPAGFGRGALDALEHKIRTACQ